MAEFPLSYCCTLMHRPLRGLFSELDDDLFDLFMHNLVALGNGL